MRKLATALREDPDHLSRKTKVTVVVPLVRTYVYNADVIGQSEVVNAAIECLGAVAASHGFKEYRLMLFGFMADPKVKDTSHEAAFKKQRVKILASIISGFHFQLDDDGAPGSGNGEMLKTLVDKLLFR